MVKIEGGSYEAFVGKDSTRIVKVNGFYIDESPVTNSEYLCFLRQNPQWTKSRVLRLYADSSYLKYWNSDYELPSNIDPEAPITNIS